MLTNSKIVYLILYVNDLVRSQDYFEQILGLRCIERDADAAKYDAGQIIICLNRAKDFGIELATSRDHSTDIVFLVDDLESMRASMESRGIEFTPTVRYQIGAIADFYDPDGHWFTLYQPSDVAMHWPSGDKLRSIMKARAVSPGATTRANPSDEPAPQARYLDGSGIVYLFLFVHDSEKTCKFYGQHLGLKQLEGGPCSQKQSGDNDDVIKYDGGGVMLATHHTEGTKMTAQVSADLSEHSCPPRELDPDHTQGVAPVFHVTRIEEVVKGLADKGVPVNGIRKSSIGAVAKFQDPSGHLFYLYEPSAEALNLPSGSKLREILTAAV